MMVASAALACTTSCGNGNKGGSRHAPADTCEARTSVEHMRMNNKQCARKLCTNSWGSCIARCCILSLHQSNSSDVPHNFHGQRAKLQL